MQISDFVDEIYQVGGEALRQDCFFNTSISKEFLEKRRYFVNDIDRLVFAKSFAVIRRHSQPTGTNRWGQEWGQTLYDHVEVSHEARKGSCSG